MNETTPEDIKETLEVVCGKWKAVILMELMATHFDSMR